jgi:hypothetical protein
MALFTNRFFSFLFSRCVDGYNPLQFHDAKLGPIRERGSSRFSISSSSVFSKTREEPRERTVTTVWNAAGLAF